MQLTKAWRIVHVVVVLALLLTAAPMAVTAQSVMSSMIRGELNEQFAKHYLGLRVIDPTQPMVITMDYSPQDNLDLDAESGFYVFESTGFARYIVGAPGPQSALGIGSLQQMDGGPKQKIHTIRTPDSTFSLVAFNDTKIPLSYTLTGENVAFVDESGEQIVDASSLAATTPTPAAETVADASVSSVVTETPSIVRASELSGELPKQFDKHYFALETTATDVTLQLHVQPQDNADVQEKVNAFLLTDSQLKAYVAGMATDLYVNNTTILQVPQDSSSLMKTADFTIDADRVGTRFTVIVGNDSTSGASYTLEVEGGILEDGSAQSRMGQSSTDAIPAATSTPAAETVAAASVSSVVIETPSIVRASELSGELPKQFDKHYFALETTATDVTLQLHVQPQDNADVQEKVNAFLLTDSQLKAYVAGMATDLYVNNTTILQVPQDSSSLMKTADFTIDADRVGTRFTVIVGNDSTSGASYTLEVEGGILEDGSAQSRMGQSSTDAIPATSPTPAAETVADAAAAPITLGTVYTVERGDTLGTIASRAFGNSDYWSAICSGNALANCDIIEVGDVLTIPTMAQADAILANVAIPETAPLEATSEMAETEMPETEMALTETTEEMAADIVPTGDLGEVAKTSGELEIFRLTLELADLIDSIASGGPFTVFAPGDVAFVALQQEVRAGLLADRTMLADVLQFHVVPGQLMAADLTTGLVQPTLQGSTVEVSTTADGTLTIGGATIIESDLIATNGVIHIIDQVLLPPEN